MCDFQCNLFALVWNVLWLLTHFWNIMHHLPPIPNPSHRKFLCLTKHFCMLCLVTHFDTGREKSKWNQFKSAGCPWAYFFVFCLLLLCSLIYFCVTWLCFRLDNNLNLKVSDFGLSRDIQTKEYYKVEDTSVELPVRWMSPESLTNWTFTTKSDVVRDVLVSS